MRRSRILVRLVHDENGIILARIVRKGSILLDPPGVALTDCFLPGGD